MKPMDTHARKLGVLVVDDDELVATTTCMILNRTGFEGVFAFNAEDALLLAQAYEFDILLTDVMMEPTNGIQLAVAFQNHYPKAKVILFSGNERTADLLISAARTGHNFPVFAKPVAPLQLIEQLQAREAAMPLFTD